MMARSTRCALTWFTALGGGLGGGPDRTRCRARAARRAFAPQVPVVIDHEQATGVGHERSTSLGWTGRRVPPCAALLLPQCSAHDKGRPPATALRPPPMTSKRTTLRPGSASIRSPGDRPARPPRRGRAPSSPARSGAAGRPAREREGDGGHASQPLTAGSGVAFRPDRGPRPRTLHPAQGYPTRTTAGATIHRTAATTTPIRLPDKAEPRANVARPTASTAAS